MGEISSDDGGRSDLRLAPTPRAKAGVLAPVQAEQSGAIPGAGTRTVDS